MRKSRKEAAETRERIVKMAAREFNESGIQAIGLAEIMAAAELTHGGFYKHFSSKDQLVGEGGEQNAPLGRAVIGGLLCATVATLLFVPVVFSYAAAATYRQTSLTAFQKSKTMSPPCAFSKTKHNSRPWLLHRNPFNFLRIVTKAASTPTSRSSPRKRSRSPTSETP